MTPDRYQLRILGAPDLRAPDGRRVTSVLSQPARLSLLSYLDLPGNLELDMGIYYHGRVGDRFSGFTSDDLSGYTRHDLRLGWRPTPHLELSLVGQNLLDRLHHEAADYFEGAALITGLPKSSVQRSVFGRVSWLF